MRTNFYNKAKWQPLSTDDMSEALKVTRIISGRLTPRRWKVIKRWERIYNQKIEYCGHAHDCCGCICGQSASVSFGEAGEVVLQYNQYRNY